MKPRYIGLGLILILAFLVQSRAFGQTAYNTTFSSAVTFQNISATPASINVEFYSQGSGQPISFHDTLGGFGATSILARNVGAGSNFLGSAVFATDQTLVSTIVQIPDGSPSVKNRPLTNSFTPPYTPVSNQVLLPTLLKNQFHTTSKFAIQNVGTINTNITVHIYDATNPSGSPLNVTRNAVPPGASAHFNMGDTNSIPISASSFNGSAVVDSSAGNIAGAVLELDTTGYAAKAFEGVSLGGTNAYMPTAFCNVFGGTNTAYAVQNVSTSGTANVTVTYYPNNGTNSETVTIAAGAKKSLDGCLKQNGTQINVAGFTGSARITSSGGNVVAIGKLYKPADANYATAFVGAGAGARKLAFPYVRYTQANYTNGTRQRVVLAIQNASGTALSANSVTVKYYNIYGVLVGTHTYNTTLPAYEKFTSASINATLSTGHTQVELDEFGNPESGIGSGKFGGSVIVEGPSGAQLVGIARVSTRDASTGVDLAEDYNGFIGIP